MVGAVWAFIEWWTTLIVVGDVGPSFLGSQGDVRDAQWEMFLVGIGGAVALATMTGLHQRSIECARAP